MRKFLFLMLSLVLVISLVGCSQSDEQVEKGEQGEQSEIVAIVNGEEVERAEYDTSLEQQKMAYQQQGLDFDSSDGKELLEQLEDQVLEDLINHKLILEEAKDKGFAATEDEVNSEIASIKTQFTDEKEFEQVLETNKLTVAQLEQEIASSITIQHYMESLKSEIDEIAVSEEELEDYYQQYSANQEEPLEFAEIKPQIEAQVKQQKEQQQLQVQIQKVLEELREKSDVEILI